MNRHKTLDALKEAQRQGKLNGILGRLGDLGIIDKRYDVAIIFIYLILIFKDPYR